MEVSILIIENDSYILSDEKKNAIEITAEIIIEHLSA